MFIFNLKITINSGITKRYKNMTTPKIFNALQNVQEYMFQNPIGKDGVNNFQKYKYRGIDQVIQSFSKPLFENKILTVVQPELDVKTDYQSDGKTTYTTINGTIRFYCTEDGSYLDRSYVGQSKSAQCKDLEAARSFAYRSALLETFCVPFEGVVEPELEGQEPAVQVTKELNEVDFYEEYRNDLNTAPNNDALQDIFNRNLKVAQLESNEEKQAKLTAIYDQVKLNEDGL